MRNRFFAVMVVLLLAPALSWSKNPIPPGPQPSQSRDLTTPAAPLGRTASAAWAYIIGINDYMYVQKLSTAVNDARSMRDLLLARYQFDSSRLLERYDRQATRMQIIDDLHLLAGRLGPEDSLLIYYAGHGYLDQSFNQGYWVPADGQADRIGSLVSNSDVRDALAGIPARHIWLISDSCFSGSLLAERGLTGAIDERYYQQKFALKSRQVMTSGGKEPVADATGNRDCAGHSVFACYLLKKLSANQNPYITPSELFPEVARVVANNSGQTPVLGPIRNSGDELGEFVLMARNAAPPAAAAAPLVPATTAPPAPAAAPAHPTATTVLGLQNRAYTSAEQAMICYTLLEWETRPDISMAQKLEGWREFLTVFPESRMAARQVAYWEKTAAANGPNVISRPRSLTKFLAEASAAKPEGRIYLCDKAQRMLKDKSLSPQDKVLMWEFLLISFPDDPGVLKQVTYWEMQVQTGGSASAEEPPKIKW